MHLTKNLCLNALVFLGCYDNSKDTLEARQDLKDIHRNEEAGPEEVEEEEQDYVGPASYTLSKKEKVLTSDFDQIQSQKDIDLIEAQKWP
jgi:hypothetical protein